MGTDGKKASCRNSKVMAHNSGARPLLNGKFTFMAGFLDQSWWPDGQYTAPTDAALESDLTATKNVWSEYDPLAPEGESRAVVLPCRSPRSCHLPGHDPKVRRGQQRHS